MAHHFYNNRNRFTMVLMNDLQEKTNRKELVWRNDFAFVRKHLVSNGWFNGDVRNEWTITEQGIAELHNLYQEVLTTSTLSYISETAKKDYIKYSKL